MTTTHRFIKRGALLEYIQKDVRHGGPSNNTLKDIARRLEPPLSDTGTRAEIVARITDQLRVFGYTDDSPVPWGPNDEPPNLPPSLYSSGGPVHRGRMPLLRRDALSMNNTWGAVLGILAAIILIAAWANTGFYFPVINDDGNEPALVTRVNAAFEELDRNPTIEEINDAIDDGVADTAAARRVRNAVETALDDEVTIRQIRRAVSQLPEDATTDDIVKAINSLEPASSATSSRRDEPTTPTVTPTVVPTTPPRAADGGKGALDSGNCALDKVGTWSEGNAPHRIEVGGHGGQHFDFYPQPGVKAISYVVSPIANPDGVPQIAFGYGSMWEGNGTACQRFDWAADATQYARARVDSGHSGLVVEWGTGRVLANVSNMSDTQIRSLLDSHKASMNEAAKSSLQSSSRAPSGTNQPASTGSTREELFQLMDEYFQSRSSRFIEGTQKQAAVRPPAFTPSRSEVRSTQTKQGASRPPASAPAPAGPDCSVSTNFAVEPIPGQSFVITPGTWAVVNVWTHGLPEHKLLLGPDDPRTLLSGGGKEFNWEARCEKAAREGFNANPLPPITLAEFNSFVRNRQAQQPQAQPPAAVSCIGELRQQSPTPNGSWIFPNDTFVAANIWSNRFHPNLPSDLSILVRPGDNHEFFAGGGTAFVFPSNCEQAARDKLASMNKREIFRVQYDAYIINHTLP